MGHLKSSKVCPKSLCAEMPAVEPTSAALLEDKERRQRFSETTGDPRRYGRHAGFYDTGHRPAQRRAGSGKKRKNTAPLLDSGNADAPPDASPGTAARNGRTAEKANIGRTKGRKSSISKAKGGPIRRVYSRSKTVIFEPFDTGVLRSSEVVLPEDNSVGSTSQRKNAYNLFSLFWPEHIWATIAENKNRYVVFRGARLEEPVSKSKRRPWYDTTPNELKVFVGAVFNMVLHHLSDISDYWNTDLARRALHTVSLHISLTQSEQLRRYPHISSPRRTTVQTVTTISSVAGIDDGAADDSDDVDSESDDEVSNEDLSAPVDVDGVWWYS
ncbi:hypothetical protein MMC29_001141 [Sticta canariensis]|nr:hypothetical protein [Sticta canariensis]